MVFRLQRFIVVHRYVQNWIIFNGHLLNIERSQYPAHHNSDRRDVQRFIGDFDKTAVFLYNISSAILLSWLYNSAARAVLGGAKRGFSLNTRRRLNSTVVHIDNRYRRQ